MFLGAPRELRPAGGGRTAFVDARDVAAVAARALIEPGHEGTAYTPTGPETLTYTQCAEILLRTFVRDTAAVWRPATLPAAGATTTSDAERYVSPVPAAIPAAPWGGAGGRAGPVTPAHRRG